MVPKGFVTDFFISPLLLPINKLPMTKYLQGKSSSQAAKLA